ncbi:hypothetical protein H7B90_23500 [Cohnella xylanilytica]|uniref:Uncharacterized protein n=1 Tax=Cohnella xylanilytica TaxID=557555 RepID=A0A841U1F6_9BACL|nr:hypothetical protein [Cohnella xylanilytica]MBB6694366.1 hypothetical protein [Cohnella xylanilytica]
MYELYEWIRQHRHNPVTWAALVPLIIIILDKLGREFITDQVKRLLHIQHRDEFKEYIANQKRIERKIDRLALYMEVPEWNVEETSYTANTVKTSSILSRLGRLSAQYVKQFTMRRRKNMNYKTLIPSLIGAIKLILQPFGVDLSEITDEQINLVVNGISALLVIWGIFAKHIKKGAKKSDATNNLNVPIESAE